MHEGVTAIVVAAGQGSRFGGLKQFRMLDGQSVVERSVAIAKTCAARVVVVVPREFSDQPVVGSDLVVAGGVTRSDSVRAGLAALGPECKIVVIHDAARPLATSGLFRLVIEAVANGAAAAIPVVPLVDTVKRVEGNSVVATVPRENLVSVQTPQAFNVECIRQAHANGQDATDDAGLVESLGLEVRALPGEMVNLKITSPQDISIASAIIAAGAA